MKVRSLPVAVPSDIDKYELRDQPSSRWGRFIRGRHLDEFPQCWLLVSGRMSLVGPRPEMPALSATYDPGFVAARLQIRPGITGPWQISPDSAGLIGESPQYDLWYLANARPTAFIVALGVVALTVVIVGALRKSRRRLLLTDGRVRG
jgi:lipopolysaccharide/colanic/teichoic acid biosynthesis glycosyltransferase